MSIPIYDSERMQEWDQFTIENEPISSLDLMERAATLATKVILGNQSFDSVAIFCGPGNNGGDGLVIARLLHEQRKNVQLYLLRFGQDSDDFEANLKRLPKDINIIELTEEQHTFNCEADLIIDAIFGSGLSRPVKGWIGEVVDGLNQTAGKKLAIDIPSGLFAKNNHKEGTDSHIFEADHTFTFMAPKMPFFFSSYNKYVGKLRILDIGLLDHFKGTPLAHYLSREDIQLKRRAPFDHKNKNGVLSIVAGLDNMNGAAIISSKAAMATGCGYLFTISGKKTHTPLNLSVPEAIWSDAEKVNFSSKTNAIAIGPGLGQSELAKQLLKATLTLNLPTVLDADAIHIIANDDHLFSLVPENSILTPHIGELHKLIGEFEHEEELLAAQLAFSQKHRLYILQKGAFSKITTPQGDVFINSAGNPGMGTAGMGDALTGVIGSLLAQGYQPQQSILYGTFIHAYAADQLYSNIGELGWTASAVIAEIPHTINKFLT